MSKPIYQLAVVALHPIQYQAGLWRTLAHHPRIDARVLYLDTVGIDGSIDPTARAAMKWEMPLLEGYEHEFVRNLSPFRFAPVIHRINPGIGARLRAHPYDAVMLHGYLTLSNWLALATARAAGCKIIYRGEGSLRGGARYDSALANLVKMPMSRTFLRKCDAIACSSADNGDYHLSRGARKDQLFPLPCAVDNEVLEELQRKAASPAEFRRRHSLPESGRLVVTVTRFMENKGTSDSIAAWLQEPLRDRPDVHLVIVGDGPLRAELERQIRDSGLEDRVHMLGFVNQPEMVEAVLAADLFLLTSWYGDPSPKALSEALFLGRAVVCSDGVGTCEDLITPGENGDIYPLRDPAACARAVARILDDDALRKSMGEASHRVARANDFQAGVDSLVAKLDEIVPSPA